MSIWTQLVDHRFSGFSGELDTKLPYGSAVKPLRVDPVSHVFIFSVRPSSNDFSDSPHHSSSVRPKSCHAMHSNNADDLGGDDLLVSGVHQFIRPVELITSDPESILVVEAICRQHVP